MKKRFYSLIFAFLITGCQNTYDPDLSLKKAWTAELESTQPSEVPYGLLYETETKKVIYLAVNGEQTSSKFIESTIDKQKPQVVLLQGHTKALINPNEVNFKIHGANKPILKGASATRADIVKNLATHNISEKDYEMFKIINLMNQVWRHEAASINQLQKKTQRYLNTNPEVKSLQISYQDIQKWFHEKTGNPLTMSSISDGTLTAPMDPSLSSTTYLQKISFYEDEIDDATVLETLGSTLRNYNSVMLIRAASKYVVEKDVLQKMLGVSQPTKVLNNH